MGFDLAPPVTRREGALALAVGAAVVLALVWTGRPPGAGAGWRIAYVAVHTLGFGLLIAGLRVRTPRVALVVVGAVALRVLALPMAPALSDDGYRYLWDGAMTVEAGVSPYALRPSDPALAEWQTSEAYERMNSPDYYSVYPPSSQAVFAAAATLGGGMGDGAWRWLKLLLVGIEMIGIVALVRWAGPQRAALYAWSPLAVLEIAGQGHTEALVVGGLGLMLWAGRGRWPVGSMGVVLAGFAKLYPFALAPAVWRREGWRGVAASVIVGVGVAAWVWHPEAVMHVRESLALFFGTLDEYAAPFRVLKAALYPGLGDAAGAVASGALGVVFAAVVLMALAVDDGTKATMAVVLAAVVIGFALTTSTLHPWYWLPVLWVIPLLESKPLLWLVLIAPATYLGYQIPGAEDLVLVVGWGGALGLWLWGRYGPAASSTSATVAVRASSHRASG